jgi:SAM-dependent methyltransferase
MSAIRSDGTETASQIGPGTFLDEADAFWVREADRWDGTSGQFGDAMLEAADLRSGQSVLDVGCGAGSTTVEAARRVDPGTAVGIDISSQALALARRRANTAGHSKIEFIEADAQTHEFEPESFDTIISRFGSMFFTDPIDAFANLRRALRPGGKLSVVAWRGPMESVWTTIAVEAAIAVFGRPPDLGAPDGPGPFAFADGDRFSTVVAEAGFKDLSLVSLTRPMVMGRDVEDAVRLVAETPQAKGLFAGQPRQRVDAAIQALRTGFAPFEAADGVVTSGKAWLLTASR